MKIPVVKIGARRPPPVPDSAVIRTLAGLLAETGLTEIEYAVGDIRIRVARGLSGSVVASAASTGSTHPVATNGASLHELHTGDKPAVNGASNGGGHSGALTSPIVGIAYLAAEPGGAPFVRVGDTVNEGQTVLIIEAMKVMNQIRAPRAGRVSRIFVEDGAPVEFGAPLLLIE